jgi:hypothetical protein
MEPKKEKSIINTFKQAFQIQKRSSTLNIRGQTTERKPIRAEPQNSDVKGEFKNPYGIQFVPKAEYDAILKKYNDICLFNDTTSLGSSNPKAYWLDRLENERNHLKNRNNTTGLKRIEELIELVVESNDVQSYVQELRQKEVELDALKSKILKLKNKSDSGLIKQDTSKDQIFASFECNKEKLQKHLVIKDYYSLNHDELTLVAGDLVDVSMVFTDGWCHGYVNIMQIQSKNTELWNVSYRTYKTDRRIRIFLHFNRT